MGFLSNVLKGIIKLVFPRTFEDIQRDKPIKLPRRYLRKIAKTGKSNKGNHNLFDYTFEDNDNDRFFRLIKAIEEFYEIELNPDDVGYDDFTSTEFPDQYIWERIKVGKE